MHEFMSRFSIIHRQSSAYLDRQLKPRGITASRYTHILVICENPGVSQEEISDRLKIDKGSVARTLQQFEQDGYITRYTAAEDKRQYRVYPTEKARALYENIHGLAMDVEGRLTKNFTDIERKILLNLLDKVVANLEQ
ncbi:MAG TPA: MarR family transcriptional regulator [Candidatus Limiplasma sp.]|nr:MarR family transcriptional regulator [Candidatus Limiplasma sp.]